MLHEQKRKKKELKIRYRKRRMFAFGAGYVKKARKSAKKIQKRRSQRCVNSETVEKLVFNVSETYKLSRTYSLDWFCAARLHGVDLDARNSCDESRVIRGAATNVANLISRHRRVHVALTRMQTGVLATAIVPASSRHE